MILQEQDILRIALEDVDEWIETARKDAAELRMHYYGENKDEYLAKIENLENQDAFDLRTSFAISNQFVCENLFRPFDALFATKGGSVDIDAPTDGVRKLLEEKLTNVKEGLDIDEYLKQIWKDKFITDPNGLIFLETKRDGSDAYVTHKGIDSIRKMVVTGIFPEYVMFEADVDVTPEVDKNASQKEKEEAAKKGYTLHWLVDDAKYYRIKRWKDKDRRPEILEDQSIDNTFFKVPAITNSPIVDTRRKLKVSPMWKQTELLTKYFRNNSIKEVVIGKHGYPIFWAYQTNTEMCTSCGGSGMVDSMGSVLTARGDTGRQKRRGVRCSTCAGDGVVYKKDVSDAILLKPPVKKDQPILDKVAGYEAPPIEGWESLREELDWTMNLIHFSLWGTMVEKEGSSRETATGRFLDAQPVMRKLNDFADIVELIKKQLIKLFGSHYAGTSFKDVSVSVSRRFVVETPDQIWAKYAQAKKDGASDTVLTQLLIAYYESEYQSNDMMLEYWTKITALDALPHCTLTEVSKLSVPQWMKDRKIYLHEFVEDKMMNEIIDTPLIDLKTALDDFIKSKQAENVDSSIGSGQAPQIPEGQTGEERPER